MTDHTMTATTTVTTYTTYGSVRGCCGHAHRTRRAAEACLADDKKGCAKHGGYSDRGIYGPGARAVTYDARCSMGSDLAERVGAS